MHERSGDPALAGLSEASGAPSGAVITPETATGEAIETRARRHTRRKGSQGARLSPGYSSGWGLLGVFFVTTALSFIYYRHGWVSPARTYSGDVGDPEQMMWFLGWVPWAVFHAHNPLLTNYALYPNGANVMWNTSIVFPALAVSPVTYLFGPIAAYNVLVTGAPILAACTAYLAFSRYVASPVAAGVGAVAFGFCPFLLYHQLGHQQLSLLALVPLIFLFLDELLVRQRWPFWVTGLLLGLATACQLLTGEEILSITVMMAFVGVLYLLVVHFRKVKAKLAYALRGGAVALGVFIVLAVFPLYEQFRGPHRVHTVHPASSYVTDLAAFLQPVGKLVSFKIVPDAWTLHVEPTGYLGIPLLIIMAVTAVVAFRRRPVVPLAVVMLAVFALLTVGPTLHVDAHPVVEMPWGWFNFAHEPLLRNILPGRLTMAIDLFSTLMLAVFVDIVISARRSLALRLCGIALVVLALVSWIPVAAGTTTIAVPSFFTSSLKDKVPQGSVALVSPYVYGSFTETALVWQSMSQMRYRMVDGWLIVPGLHWGGKTIASNTLLRLETQPVSVTTSLRTEFMSYLHSVNVAEVIVGPGPGAAQQLKFFRTLFGQGPYLSAGGVNIWRVP